MRATRLLLLAVLSLLGWLPLASVSAQEHPAGAAQVPAGQVPAGQAPAGQAPAGQAPAGQAPAGQAPAGEAHAPQGAHKSTLEMDNKEIFDALFGHSVPHPVWPHLEHASEGAPGDHAAGEKPAVPLYAFYNVNLWQLISLGLVFLAMLSVAGSFRQGAKPGWLTRVFRGWCRWVRDEMVYAVMGKEEGRPWVPFFLFLFFFVTGMNVIGLIPSIPGLGFEPTTATGTPFVTAPLAIITLLLMLAFGIQHNGGFGFFKGLLPHGLPIALIPLMAVVEVVGLIVKPFALTVRLFANMLAGHLVIAAAIGLIFVFTKMFSGSALSYVTAVPAVGMAVFIYIIESFVVLLQAYIFTYLSVIFLQQAIHQEH